MTLRQRRPHPRATLTEDEQLHLLHGSDQMPARAAWERHRDELTEAAASRGLVPYAAFLFDGATAGHTSKYCHLGGPCGHRLAEKEMLDDGRRQER